MYICMYIHMQPWEATGDPRVVQNSVQARPLAEPRVLLLTFGGNNTVGSLRNKTQLQQGR